MIFEGVATALYTPFNDSGINYEQLDNLIARQLKAKVDALVVLGTTGECSTVTRKERKEIIKFARKKTKGKIPLIVGCGSNCTKTACELSTEAKDLGADCALTVTPYYNKCEQDGLFLHYKEIATQSKFPIICYNVPTRTGVNIDPETAEKLTHLDFVVGFKEASQNKTQIENLFTFTQNKKAIYCGSDELIGLFHKRGAKGVISVASNIIPLKIKEFIRDFQNDYENTNQKFEYQLSELVSALFKKVNPIPIKALAEIIYNEQCYFRLPLTRPDNEFFEYLKKVLSRLKVKF